LLSFYTAQRRNLARLLIVNQVAQELWRDLPTLTIIGHHHHGFWVEFNQRARAKTAIRIKANALSQIELHHRTYGAALLEQL
jgi:hypothetical protein